MRPWPASRGGVVTCAVRFLGALLFALASAGTVYSIWAMYHHSRPADVLFALVAPVAALLALTGLLLVFVPGFFG